MLTKIPLWFCRPKKVHVKFYTFDQQTPTSQFFENDNSATLLPFYFYSVKHKMLHQSPCLHRGATKQHSAAPPQALKRRRTLHAVPHTARASVSSEADIAPIQGYQAKGSRTVVLAVDDSSVSDTVPSLLARKPPGTGCTHTHTCTSLVVMLHHQHNTFAYFCLLLPTA